jgi:F-type H+-transporting ATPase subunit b
MPQFDFTFYISQIFWMCVSFGLLFWAMHKWIMPKIQHLRQQRQQQMSDLLEKAVQIRVEADHLFDRVEQSLQQARMDAEMVISEASVSSQITLQQALKVQQMSYHAQMEELERTVQKEREHAWKGLCESVPMLSESVIQMWSNNTPDQQKEFS